MYKIYIMKAKQRNNQTIKTWRETNKTLYKQVNVT